LMKERAGGTMIYKSTESHMGFFGSISWPVFSSTRPDSSPWSARSRVDPSGQAGF
jgi:hypothetical protein